MAVKKHSICATLVRVALSSKGGDAISAKTRHTLSATLVWPRTGIASRAYARAVEHMTEQDVLRGFDDGGFHPADTLTREQGAKIITYLLLGAETADALTGGAAPFTDVAASRWSAPGIAWCSDRHILDGYGLS